MPVVHISVRNVFTAAEKTGLMEAVHGALVDAFKILPRDRHIRIQEFREEDFLLAPGASERSALVEISAFPGRSADAKATLYRNIVTNFEAFGIAPIDVKIVIIEPPLENWGVRGGIPGNKVELGYKLDV